MEKLRVGRPVAEWGPIPEPQKVREQLSRILVATPFRNSQRYRGFLQHVVERTLAGHANEIKERTLGIDVFGRSPDYNTTSDPVVRITAAEVRRRLAQYYADAAHESELRIILSSGSYIPEFREEARIPEEAPPPVPIGNLADDAIVKAPLGKLLVPERSHQLPVAATLRRKWFAWLAWLALPALVGSFWAGSHWPAAKSSSRALDAFWAPLRSSRSPVLVSVGELGALYGENQSIRNDESLTTPGENMSPDAPVTLSALLEHNAVAWADTVTAAKLSLLIGTQGGSSYLRRSKLTSLADLRRSPAVLVGGFNNKWIMHLMSGFRFAYRDDEEKGTYWIQDKQNPASRKWSVDFRQNPAYFRRDFGIVARFWDAATEKPIVVASGIAAYGTIAASEFLTTPRYMDQLARRAPPRWEQRNIEVVFSAMIVDGNIGPPEILEIHCW